MSVKLIASDIDGTLLLNHAKEIPEEIFREVRRLKEKGILFCPASGRQYNSLKNLFAPIAEDCIFVCDNGAVVYRGDGVILSKTAMPRALCEELAEEIEAADGCDPVFSGANMIYVCSREEHLMRDLTYFVGDNYTVVDRPQDIPEDIVKVCAYCRQGAAVYEQQVSQRWKETFNVAVAGVPWLDFTCASKGLGLANLCKVLSVDSADVMAFGDNFNDCSMLDFAGQPYLMASGNSALLSRYPNHCTTVAEVLKTL